MLGRKEEKKKEKDLVASQVSCLPEINYVSAFRLQQLYNNADNYIGLLLHLRVTKYAESANFLNI